MGDILLIHTPRWEPGRFICGEMNHSSFLAKSSGFIRVAAPEISGFEAWTETISEEDEA
jgi:hypothetical protein